MSNIKAKKYNRNIAIMAAAVAATVAASAIINGIAESDYVKGQAKLTNFMNNNQLLVLAILQFQEGDAKSGSFLYAEVSGEPRGVTYSKEDAVDYYANTLPRIYSGILADYKEGDLMRGISGLLIAISAALSGIIAGYAARSRSDSIPTGPAPS